MADIRHLVILMMENRSFDHMLGYLGSAGMDVDGKIGQSNVAEDGTVVRGHHLDSTRVRAQPHHTIDAVAAQINDGLMDGFVRGYRSADDLAEIMSWYDEREMRTYDRLARQYVVCDRWFASVPGPTWPNRFFALCGTSSGIVANGNRIGHPTFFDLLPKDSWRYFSHDIAFLRTVTHYSAHLGPPIEKISAFYRACLEGTLPSVSWIDPNFTLVGPDALLNWANDDHPPADIARGQNLVARIYNYLLASKCWANTLFVVVYDEHGGFYDHVAPPASGTGEPAPFDRLGVRVPALVVSPWVRAGQSHHGVLEHSCIARTALELFAPATVDQLAVRVSRSPSLLPLLTEPNARTDRIRLEGMPVIEQAIAPIAQGETAPPGFHSMELTENQQQIEALKSQALASGVPTELH
jgi:phospholipase C